MSKTKKTWRITRGILNLIIPISETGVIYRAIRHMTVSHAERIRQCLPEKPPEEKSVGAVSASWEAAVAATGLTPAILDKNYSRQRTIWRISFWVLTLSVVIICGISIHASTLPTVTVSRQLITCVILLGGAAVTWSRALIVTYRLWQLRGHRVSEEERGTFRDFLVDVGGWGKTTQWALVGK
ncbi:conjugal transfer protein TraX [Salmonella enterica]|nr:conjugal transfer protein TraX [Salmonella enterica]